MHIAPRWRGLSPRFPDPAHTHHEVPAQHQGHNLPVSEARSHSRRRAAPPPPPAGPRAGLPVVARAEHTVQAEEQQHKHDARGQAKCRHSLHRAESGEPCPGPRPAAAPPPTRAPYLYRVRSLCAMPCLAPWGPASRAHPARAGAGARCSGRPEGAGPPELLAGSSGSVTGMTGSRLTYLGAG